MKKKIESEEEKEIKAFKNRVLKTDLIVIALSLLLSVAVLAIMFSLVIGVER